MARFGGCLAHLVVCYTLSALFQSDAVWGQTRPLAAPSKADNVTAILNSLLQGYDKRLRPNFGGPSVPINISMFIYSMGPVSEAHMQYTIDVYFRQQWRDERLKFDGSVDLLSLNAEMVEQLWVPDTYFVNEKSAKFHDILSKNTLIQIDRHGNMLYSTRLTVTASCYMNLAYFPMDKQRCSLTMESYAYSDNDVHYYWIPSGPIYVDESVTLPQFKLLGNGHRFKTAQYYVGNYSQLVVDLYLGREISYYVINVYMPSTLIVIISWVSFWIPRSSTPARTALGITTVLTMTTLIGNAGSSLPKLSYIKAIDLYLEMCYFFVFAALLEFALVSYYEKPSYKEARERLKRRDANDNHTPSSRKSGSPSSVYSVDKRQNEIEISFISDNGNSKANMSRAEMMARSGARRGSYIRAAQRGSPPAATADAPVRTPSPTRRVSKCEEMFGPNCADFGEAGIDPSRVDSNSRKAFPIVFLILKVVYWVYYLVVTGGGIEDLIVRE